MKMEEDLVVGESVGGAVVDINGEVMWNGQVVHGQSEQGVSDIHPETVVETIESIIVPDTDTKPISTSARRQTKRKGGIGLVADAGSALGSAVYCIAKCETLLTAANEDVCDKKALVSVLVKLKDIKDNLGNLLDELSRSVIKLDGKDELHPFMIDEYLVKSELSEDQYNTENLNDFDDLDLSFPEDYSDDKDDKDFLPPSSSKIKAEDGENRTKYKRKPICSNCDCRFKSLDELEAHKETCESKGTFSCAHCHKIFPNVRKLQHHVNLKHMNNTCDVCNQSFDSRKNLIKHRTQEKHHPDEKKIYCDKCDKVLLSRKAYDMHVEQFHSKKHVCTNCGEAFDLLKELRSHMKDVHRIKLKNFSCGTCNEVFHDVVSLQQHMNITNHSTSSTCEFCGKVCASEGTLKVHMKIKHTQKFECDECGEVLESKMDMRKHKAAKHAPEQPSQFVCQTCGHSTKNKDAFRHHLKIHQAKKHKCDVCEKLFTLKHSLTTHYRIHTGEKPLVCQICGMRFRKSSGLCQHRAIHTGEKPYVCQLCGKGFVQKGGLKTHMKSHISGSLPILKE